MRAAVSRVDGASVEVAGEVVGAIDGAGWLVLVGVTHSDDNATATRLADKVAGLRVFPAAVPDGSERSVREIGGAVLLVSQFTLYGDTGRGRRPSWNGAAPAELAGPLVDSVADRLRATGVSVATGAFGAFMRVSSVNDGPFTVLLEL